jgi:lipopolysaccharide transport system ATP-binding protein
MRTDRKGLGQVRLVGVDVSASQNGSSMLRSGRPARFVFSVDTLLSGMACNFFIYDTIGQPVTSFRSRVRGPEDASGPRNETKFICELDELLLRPGRYRIDVAIIGDNRLQDFVEAAAMIEVAEGHVAGRPSEPDGKFSISMAHRWILPTKN